LHGSAAGHSWLSLARERDGDSEARPTLIARASERRFDSARRALIRAQANQTNLTPRTELAFRFAAERKEGRRG